MSKNLFRVLGVSTIMAGAVVAGDCSVKSGAYAGVNAGVSHLGGKNEAAITGTTAAGNYPSYKDKLSSSSVVGSIFTGYGMKLGSFWAGIELFYKFDSLKSSSKHKLNNVGNGNDLTLSSKSGGAYGADLHLGVLANDKTIAYLIAGVEARHFKVKFTPDRTDFATALRKSYSSVTVVPGLGVRFNIARNLAIRTEYKLAMHRKKNFTATAASPGFAGHTDTLKVKHAPKVHSFQVGAVYTF